MFWSAFWIMLLVAAFFLHKVYNFFFIQHVLPWLASSEASTASPSPSSSSNSLEGMDDDHKGSLAEHPIQGWFWSGNFCAKGLRLVVYYLGLAGTIAFYMVLALRFNWKGFGSVYDMPFANGLVRT